MQFFMSPCFLRWQALPLARMIHGAKWRVELKKDRNSAPLILLKRAKHQRLQLSSDIPGAVSWLLELLDKLQSGEVTEDELKRCKADFLKVRALNSSPALLPARS